MRRRAIFFWFVAHSCQAKLSIMKISTNIDIFKFSRFWKHHRRSVVLKSTEANASFPFWEGADLARIEECFLSQRACDQCIEGVYEFMEYKFWKRIYSTMRLIS
jgi:hypothetical protein